MDRVPPEIVREILQCLEQNDLRRAAAVSRTFYASAWRAGLFIHRALLWNQRTTCEDQLATLKEVVQHALRKSLRLSLSITSRSFGDSESQIDTSTPGATFLEVLSVVPIALPVLLALSVTVSDAMIPRLADVLRQPAPHLHDFSLSLDATGYVSTPEVQADLFIGAAPKLRHVALFDFSPGRNPIAAFARVPSVHLNYTLPCPEIAFSRHFPALRTLYLEYFTLSMAPPPIPYDLRGVHLDRLTIDDSVPPMLLPAVLCGDRAIDVPVVEYISALPEWKEALWQRARDGPSSIRLLGHMTADSDVTILIAPEHRRWFRQYNVYKWLPDWPFPVADLPQLGKRLTYLRMDNLYLVGFLGCSVELTFGALRELQIDFYSHVAHSGMVWPPDWLHVLGDGTFRFSHNNKSAPTFEGQSYCYVYCPALRTVRLLAADAQMSVSSLEVAWFGRALCQSRMQVKAALELHGIALEEPVAHALLGETFSVVRNYGFTGWDGPVGRDSGLWDNR